MSVLQKLTEGIVNRDLQKEGAALLNKWEATGLLEGLESDSQRNGMARLLENQAKELLREASSMAGGDVEGFAAVAFPIVRRVFGGLIANDLVSVQPMSLPSGLIFFLDFTYANSRSASQGMYVAGESIYGGGVVGSELTGGISTAGNEGQGITGSFYNLSTGYSSPTGSFELTEGNNSTEAAMSDNDFIDAGNSTAQLNALDAGPVAISALTEAQKKLLRFDPDVLGSTSTDEVGVIIIKLPVTEMAKINLDNLTAINLAETDGSAMDAGAGDIRVLRRLTELGYRNAAGNVVTNSEAQYITFYCQGDTGSNFDMAAVLRVYYPLKDNFAAANATGAVVGAEDWGLEGAGASAATFDGASRDLMPEIDIKVDSVAVTAMTKKLKAKWTPELGQDLNAYHNLDAEVELTGILSEQVALEIDREILNDLVRGGSAGTYYWSRSPGLFVDRIKGTELGATAAAPDFTGTVSEWYETLAETINDVSAQIHRKTLRGGATFIVCSPEVANILEFTSGFRASVTGDDDRGTVGTVKVGAMSRKWDVYVDPYFPRNLCLVGRNGGSFLETGYVYAPYVPLQVTPTIFGVEDFVPRKGVMTRYAKQMVRADMYGVVIVRGLLGESGAS